MDTSDVIVYVLLCLIASAEVILAISVIYRLLLGRNFRLCCVLSTITIALVTIYITLCFFLPMSIYGWRQ